VDGQCDCGLCCGARMLHRPLLENAPRLSVSACQAGIWHHACLLLLDFLQKYLFEYCGSRC
jgi:hypothetical protein